MKPYEEMRIVNKNNAKDAMAFIARIKNIAKASQRKALDIYIPGMYESMAILGIAEFVIEPYGSIVWNITNNTFQVNFKSRLSKIEFINDYNDLEEEINPCDIKFLVNLVSLNSGIIKLHDEYLKFMNAALALGYSSCVFYLGYTNESLCGIINILNILPEKFGRAIKIAYKNKFLKISWDNSKDFPILSDSDISIYREVADILFGTNGIMYAYNKESELLNSNKVEYSHTDIKCKFKESYDIEIANILMKAMTIIGYSSFDLSFENGKLAGVVFHFK